MQNNSCDTKLREVITPRNDRQRSSNDLPPDSRGNGVEVPESDGRGEPVWRWLLSVDALATTERGAGS